MVNISEISGRIVENIMIKITDAEKIGNNVMGIYEIFRKLAKEIYDKVRKQE